MLKETKKLAIDKEVEVEDYKIQPHFFPLPDNPYVCFHKANYLLWPDLLPLTGLKPVELGRGLTTRQEIYLLENSEGYIGSEGWAATQCRVLGKPVVILKDAYPEEIVNELLEKLNKEKTERKSLHVGRDYIRPQVDFIPDFPLFNQSLVSPDSGVNIRLDLAFNLQYAATALFRKCVVITDKPIVPEFINQYKNNIEVLVYFLKENHDAKFVDFIHKSGIKYTLISALPKKYLPDLRLQYFDYNPPMQLAFDSIELPEGAKFKTNRKFLSQGKFFSSEWHLSRLKTAQEEEETTEEMLKDISFLKTINSCYFYLSDSKNP